MSVLSPASAQGTLLSADGTELFWRSWFVPGASHTLAVLHGHGEHSGRYEGFGRALAAAGINTHAVDWRGHGKSGGRRGHALRWSELLDDAKAFFDHVKSRSEGEVIPLGHSVGGAIVASSIIRATLRPGRFVLSSPALRVKAKVPGWKLKVGEWASNGIPTLALDSGLDLAGLSRDPAVATTYKEDPLTHSKISARFYTEWMAANAEIMKRAPEVQLPFLATHGSGDPIIDPAATEEFVDSAGSKDKVLIVYPDHLHEPYNEIGKERVLSDLAGWVKGS